MKPVLMICALTIALTFAVSVDCQDAAAGYADNPGESAVEAVQLPPGGQGIHGACGGGSADGDPDDLGGGFRSTNGQTREAVVVVKPPVLTTLMMLTLRAQQIWMTILP